MKLLLLRGLESLQASYWVIPTIMAVTGMLLVPAQYLVHALLPEALLQLSFFTHLQNMSIATARAILGTVAAASIGTASVVFSVSIVVLSLTANQFGPRLLKNFLKQGVAQLTLGIFIATFMFSLFGFTLLEDSLNGVQISYLLVSMTIALGAGSFFVLIFYIHHIANFIQAPRVIDDASRALMARIKQLPEIGERSRESAASREDLVPPESSRLELELTTHRSGYLQSIDLEALMDRATRDNLHLTLRVYPGQFVLINQVVAIVSSPGRMTNFEPEDLLSAFSMGSERSATQDLTFALDQMVEIGLRALSPGINDPYTAINCINQLAAGLSLLAGRSLPDARLLDENGVERIRKPHMRYEDALDAAFSQIREHGSKDRAVTGHLLHTLLELYELPAPKDFREAVVDNLKILDKQMKDAASPRPKSESDRRRLQRALGETPAC